MVYVLKGPASIFSSAVRSSKAPVDLFTQSEPRGAAAVSTVGLCF